MNIYNNRSIPPIQDIAIDIMGENRRGFLHTPTTEELEEENIITPNREHFMTQQPEFQLGKGRRLSKSRGEFQRGTSVNFGSGSAKTLNQCKILVHNNRSIHLERELLLEEAVTNSQQRLQDKLVEMTKAVKEQIDNCDAGKNILNIELTKKRKKIKTGESVEHAKTGDESNEERKDKKKEVEDTMVAANGEIRWKKRASELTNEVEMLKRRLCVVELELEAAKLNVAPNKRRKTKVAQRIKEEVEQGTSVSTTTLNAKQSGKVTTAKRGSKRHIEPDCQIFEKIQGTNDEVWKSFDIHQAISFLQQIKLLIQANSMFTPAMGTLNAVLKDSPFQHGIVIKQAIVKIIGFMSAKLTDVLHVIENATVDSKARQSYPSLFLESPILSISEKSEIMETLANSFASLIKAIHVLSKRMIRDLFQESTDSVDNTTTAYNDPRNVISELLIHVCNVEPRLKEAVSFVAAKECLRLVFEEFEENRLMPSQDGSSPHGEIVPFMTTKISLSCEEVNNETLSKIDKEVK
ncbi:10110_t:CDS:2, partial [Acaulospora colombiana]